MARSLAVQAATASTPPPVRCRPTLRTARHRLRLRTPRRAKPPGNRIKNGARSSSRASFLRAALVAEQRRQHRFGQRAPRIGVVAAGYLEHLDVHAARRELLVEAFRCGLDPRVVA